jgi:signal transduction histidine kinase
VSRRVWYRSLYWRIALGFITCVAVLLATQALLFFWLTNREGAPVLGGSPRDVAAVVASDISTALEANPALDIEAHLRNHFGGGPYRLFIVLEDGRVLRNRPFEVPEGLVWFARRHLRREDEVPDHAVGHWPAEPEHGDRRPPRFQRLAAAAVVVAGRPIGLVVALPGGRPFFIALRTYAPSLALTALGLLLAGTAIMAFFVFNPVRRRLQTLEHAADAIGRGVTGVRAPEDGGDEVSALARTFNRMAVELERRMQELQEADRARRQLLADVSHELMTPLTAMRGYLETLAMPEVVRRADDRDRYLRIVSEETSRLEAIVGDLLDLARVEGSGVALQRAPVRVEMLFGRAAERHEPALREKGIALDVQIAADATLVAGDERRLEQAVQNLVANAVRHTPVGGRVTLSAGRVNGRVRLRIEDTGPGIPAEHLSRVFDRFYRVDAARDQTSGGSGLGLSIVRAIVDRHGGTVAVSSEPGKGARFDVLLDAPDGNESSAAR